MCADAALLATAQAGQVQLPKEKPFGQLLRSKGQAWIAGPSRHDHLGEWSSAGDVLQLTSGGPWAAMLPVKYWPEDQEKREMMLQDFVPGVGDRCARVASGLMLLALWLVGECYMCGLVLLQLACDPCQYVRATVSHEAHDWRNSVQFNGHLQAAGARVHWLGAE